MTEAEWLACTDPSRMLAFLDGKNRDSRLQALADACRLLAGTNSFGLRQVSGVADASSLSPALLTLVALTDLPRARAVALVREIFGNPFRPVTLDPAWLAWNGGTVPALAQSIYDERAFDRMLILADALEDAGCHDADILAHCRGAGLHALGCWVVDLFLKKA